MRKCTYIFVPVFKAKKKKSQTDAETECNRFKAEKEKERRNKVSLSGFIKCVTTEYEFWNRHCNSKV